MKLYLVNFLGGASGTFITSLLYDWLLGDAKIRHFSQYGDSHNQENFQANWINGEDWKSSNEHKQFEMLKPLNAELPFVLYQHRKLTIQEIENKSSDYLLIKILLEEQDADLISALRFYKWVVKQYNDGDPIKWDALRNIHGSNASSDPNYLNKHELKFYLDQMSKGISRIISSESAYWKDPTINDKICTINFRDIYKNPETILNTLSNRIGKEITPNLVRTYNNYLAANRNIIQHHCPWIDI